MIDASAINGKRHEMMVKEVFENCGYTVNSHSKLKHTPCNGMSSLVPPLLISQYKYPVMDVASGFGRLDFYDSYLDIGIECKFQEVSGTALEKMYRPVAILSEQRFNSWIVFNGTKIGDVFITYLRSVIMKLGAENKVKLIKITELESAIYNETLHKQEVRQTEINRMFCRHLGEVTKCNGACMLG